MTDQESKQRPEIGKILSAIETYHLARRNSELVGNQYGDRDMAESLIADIERALREGMAMRVPDEIPVPHDTDHGDRCYRNGWNACRAAMLKDSTK